MASKAPKPTIRDLASKAICPNCGGQVQRRSARGPMPKFCKPECKREFETRAIVRGRTVMALLQAWRVDRGSGEVAQGAFAQVCQITDLFNAEDHAAGRPRPDLYAAKLLVDGTMYFDRQRQR